MLRKTPPSRPFSRRDFLWRTGGGLGGIALAYLLNQPTANASAGILRDRLQFPPKATRVIQLFMNGGVSQVDTFDYKPLLEKLHGKKFDPGAHVEAATSTPGAVMRSPFEFKQYGQCGRWVSSVFPHVAQHVDDIAFIMSMASKTNVHGPGSYMANTGFILPGFPCMGAWLSYGLGNLSDNLPTFVVMPDPRGLPYNNLGNFSAGFLPAAHAGTVIRPTAPTPIADLYPPKDSTITPASESDGLALLEKLNRNYTNQNPGDSRLEARIASYELAAKMQLSAPELLDLTGEAQETKNLYGLDDKSTEEFGRRCLTGRRMLERGVRFVQIWSGASGALNNWDNHNDIGKQLPPIAQSVDKPIAGLLSDLKRRGMLDETLVLFTTEFGRMPFSQGSVGRDHNGGCFVNWLAGGGVRGGVSFGESDEWGWKARNPTYCYDYHATILRLLGIDHKQLTFRHNGIDRRLTDVHGNVIDAIV